MNNRDYWRKRYLQLKQQMLDNDKEYELELSKRMNALQAQMRNEFNYWFKRYASNNNIPVSEAKKIMETIDTKHWRLTLEQFRKKAIKGGYEKQLNDEYFRSQIYRLQQLEQQLQEYGAQFAANESPNMENKLANQFQDTYMKTNFLIQKQAAAFTTSFAHFSEEQLRTAISKPWKAENFSSRIWRNYRDELPSQLMDSIMRGTLTGRSYNEIDKEFQQRFSDVKKSNIHRLVITEMGHTQETATSKSYEENDIEKYEYLATLESRTCQICRHLDGKIFLYSNKLEGTNYPLIHPYCRCTTVPYVSVSNQIGNVRRDEDAKVNIQNMTYKEWAKKQAAQTEML